MNAPIRERAARRAVAKTEPRVAAVCELLHCMTVSTHFAGDDHLPSGALAQRLKRRCNVSLRVTLGLKALYISSWPETQHLPAAHCSRHD
jgi:hypothetical protein